MSAYKYFHGITFDTPIEDIKKQHHRLCMELHPDLGGSTEEFIAMAAEYDELLKHHQTYHRAANGSTYEREPEKPEKPGEFSALMYDLLRIPGLEIDLTGCWVWVHGDTRGHKEELKALGLKWSGQRQMWYKAPSDPRRRGGHSKKSYMELQLKYGSTTYRACESVALATA